MRTTSPLTLAVLALLPTSALASEGEASDPVDAKEAHEQTTTAVDPEDEEELGWLHRLFDRSDSRTDTTPTTEVRQSMQRNVQDAQVERRDAQEPESDDPRTNGPTP